jgi:predicted RNA-binding Zn ribbon-like protein
VYLDHDSTVGVDDAVGLINTADSRAGDELLADPQALSNFLNKRGNTGARTGTVAEVRSVHRLRARLRAIFELAADDRGDEAVEAVNALLTWSNPTPRLIRHDDQPLHLHYSPVDAPIDRFLGAEMGIALAIVIRDCGIERLRLCPAPNCGRAFVDLTKNQSRRFCDTQCANRVHAAAYRQRHSS